MFGVSSTLQNAHDNLFTGNATAGNGLLTPSLRHILSAATDKGFVCLKLAAALDERAGLHGKPDPVQHKLSRFLGYADRAAQFIGANAILAVRNLPNRHKPLVERQRAILKNGADFGRKLLFGVPFPAFPHAAGGNETNIVTTAGRATDPVGPTKLYHGLVRH
jgi:hypothetical protein